MSAKPHCMVVLIMRIHCDLKMIQIHQLVQQKYFWSDQIQFSYYISGRHIVVPVPSPLVPAPSSLQFCPPQSCLAARPIQSSPRMRVHEMNMLEYVLRVWEMPGTPQAQYVTWLPTLCSYKLLIVKACL